VRNSLRQYVEWLMVGSLAFYCAAFFAGAVAGLLESLWLARGRGFLKNFGERTGPVGAVAWKVHRAALLAVAAAYGLAAVLWLCGVIDA
jgi:hypothetical protein